MKKKSVFLYTTLILTFAVMFPTAAYANSSWRWISETRPYDVLPFVMAVTLAVETLGICWWTKIKKVHLVFFWVLVANAVSFAVSYLPALNTVVHTVEQNLEHTPIYNVGILYLAATLIVECPLVKHCLQKYTAEGKSLLKTVIVLNIITTVFTAVVERIICQGTW